MNTRDLLLANLDEAYERKAWHGANLRGAIRGLDVATVFRRPAAGRHNIWELVAHAAYWKYAVKRRLRGDKRGSFPLKGSDWFPSPDGDADAWHAVVIVLDAEHRQLRETVESLPAAALDVAKTVRMIYGVAAHDLYHTGQIQLIKRL